MNDKYEARYEMTMGDPRAPLEFDDDCETAGHEWEDAGGGLLVCMRCETEKWAEYPQETHGERSCGYPYCNCAGRPETECQDRRAASVRPERTMDP